MGSSEIPVHDIDQSPAVLERYFTILTAQAGGTDSQAMSVDNLGDVSDYRPGGSTERSTCKDPVGNMRFNIYFQRSQKSWNVRAGRPQQGNTNAEISDTRSSPGAVPPEPIQRQTTSGVLTTPVHSGDNSRPATSELTQSPQAIRPRLAGHDNVLRDRHITSAQQVMQAAFGSNDIQITNHAREVYPIEMINKTVNILRDQALQLDGLQDQLQ